MRYLLSLLLALALPVVALAQPVKVSVQSKVTASQIYEESILEVGDFLVFDFTPSDGSKPFGGKPYRIECESRDNAETPTYWRGKVEKDDGSTSDQAIVFAGNNSPENLSVRVVVDNKTIYRHTVVINKKKLPPAPSPYVSVIREAYAKDNRASNDALSSYIAIFKLSRDSLQQFNTGADLWKFIDAEYKRAPVLVNTRMAIAQILDNTTRKYYETVLSASDKKQISSVLLDIQSALEEIAKGPAPTPVPVGPKRLWLVVIEETSQAAENRGAFFASKALADKIKASGHKFRTADKDVKDENGRTPSDLVPYLNEASGKALPRLYLVDQATGDVHYKDKLPSSPNELVEILTKIGG